VGEKAVDNFRNGIIEQRRSKQTMSLTKTAVCVMVVMAGASLAGAATKGLKGTGHDFSTPANQTWNTRSPNGTNAMEICYPCHTPHHANEDTGYLWNHALSDPSLLTFGSTNDALVANGKSLMCLGCHDGVTALDAYGYVNKGNGTNGVNMTTFSPRAAIGPDLSNDHPIGVDYAAAAAARPTSFAAVTWTNSSSGEVRAYVISQASLSGTKMSLPLEVDGTAARVGCGTCHKPHDNDFGYFMRYSNKGSYICITCHGSKWDGTATH
jgi:predicted CXXCH cytochrome family protein